MHAGFCWRDYWVGLNCGTGLCWGLWLLWNLLGGKVGNEWVMVVALVRGWVLIGWKKETDSHGRQEVYSLGGVCGTTPCKQHRQWAYFFP